MLASSLMVVLPAQLFYKITKISLTGHTAVNYDGF